MMEIFDKIIIVLTAAAMAVVTFWVFWHYLGSMARGIAAMVSGKGSDLSEPVANMAPVAADSTPAN